MPVDIKICGFTEVSEVGFLADARRMFKVAGDRKDQNGCVRYAGIVMFCEKSKRNVTPEKAAKIIRAIRKLEEEGIFISITAVTVSPDIKQVSIIEELGFDIIQIHGELKKEVLDALSIPVFRAYNIESGDEFREEILNTENGRKISGIVLDAKEPGSGSSFDWNLAGKFDRKGKLLILAGGLNETNVSEAVRIVRPDVVDVSTGVEYKDGTRPGKDPERIREFTDAVINSDAEII